jgi:hypothetical protein
MDQARHELVHGISSLIDRPTNLGRTATDHPHIKHASAAMTLDIYADLFDDDLEAVATALDEARARESVGKMWARPREPTR